MPNISPIFNKSELDQTQILILIKSVTITWTQTKNYIVQIVVGIILTVSAEKQESMIIRFK